MSVDPQRLERLLTGETGLSFEAATGTDAQGQSYYLVRPRGLPAEHTFAIRTTVYWRRLRIAFEPGTFAGALLGEMGRADEAGRAAFRAVLTDCRERGAEIQFRVNGMPQPFDGEDAWAKIWNRFDLSLSKGQLELGAEDGESDSDIICRWVGRFAAAVVAILPIEEDQETFEEGAAGFPEGALTSVQANRYERDRRNRAAAISIHGTSCVACRVDLGERYGEAAVGFIEVHHVTPVSKLVAGYVIDPRRDLVPLCPNCHAIAHRREPPFSVEEITAMLS